MTPADLIQAKYWAELDTESGDYWDKDTQMRVPRLACQDWRGEYLRRVLEEIDRLRKENEEISTDAENLLVDFNQAQIKYEGHVRDLKNRIARLNGCGCEYNIDCIHDDDCARWGLVKALSEACDIADRCREPNPYDKGMRDRIAELRKVGK